MILTPEQAYTIVRNLREPERSLTLLAAGTGLRISRMLGLAMASRQFSRRNDPCASDVDVRPSGFSEEQSVQGSCAAPPIAGRIHPLPEAEDAVFAAGDCVLPSFRLKGKQPRGANMLVEDHLRPAAVKAGILSLR